MNGRFLHAQTPTADITERWLEAVFMQIRDEPNPYYKGSNANNAFERMRRLAIAATAGAQLLRISEIDDERGGS